ncbi:hypothetical protein QJQ45_019785, partial [Haematococcus lacustris]
MQQPQQQTGAYRPLPLTLTPSVPLSTPTHQQQQQQQALGRPQQQAQGRQEQRPQDCQVHQEAPAQKRRGRGQGQGQGQEPGWQGPGQGRGRGQGQGQVQGQGQGCQGQQQHGPGQSRSQRAADRRAAKAPADASLGSENAPILIDTDSEPDQPPAPSRPAANGCTPSPAAAPSGDREWVPSPSLAPHGGELRGDAGPSLGSRRSERLQSGREGGVQQPAPRAEVMCQGLSMRYPDSSDGRAVVTVVGGDLAWLEEEAFLNDTIIDFFIREKATAAAKAKAKAARKEQQQLEAALEASRLDAGIVDNTSAAARRPGGVAGQGTAGADLGQQSSSELEIEYEEEGGPGTGQGQEEGQGMQQQQQGGEARTGKAAMVASGPGPSRGVPAKKPAPVLHGAAAHARVKKWTKNVDLFSKDYVFVPIHEALHWSLALICHPGRWAQQQGQPSTCILHLDSMASGRLHTPNTIFQTLRNYLAAEWASNAADPRPSTARAWAEAHPDAASPSFNKEQCPCACCKGLPQQDNHCDCGLFLLSYIDFFCHADPAYIDHNLLPCTAAAMKKRGGGDTASLVPNQPAFMTVNWFTADNVNGLRQYLRYLIFQGMLQQQPQCPSNVATYLQKEMRTYESSCKNHILGQHYLTPSDFLLWTQQELMSKQQQQQQRQLKAAPLLPPLPTLTTEAQQPTGASSSPALDSLVVYIDGEEAEETAPQPAAQLARGMPPAAPPSLPPDAPSPCPAPAASPSSTAPAAGGAAGKEGKGPVREGGAKRTLLLAVCKRVVSTVLN